MAEVPAPFGKYYLTEKLAAGGMAELYLGKLLGPGGFEKLLVIKQIHPRFSGLRHFVDLFVAEAKTLVGLVHGNIVPVYELGVLGDTYYIAMEYIDGPSLYRLTEQLRAAGKPMEPALAAHIATKILDGLDYAHRKGEGVIHRDLSGRNVMLSRDGDVKIVDFGIAVTFGDAGDHAGELPAGSFPYMSPEQVRREPLTGQSDLFSAGILLWEMLTGERLFARVDAATTMAAVLEAPIPRPSERNPAVPGRLDDVVIKALRRERSERWGSAAEMLAALHRYLYSLAETPGARELSQLVARHCPPSVRRHHTDADATPRGVEPGEARADDHDESTQTSSPPPAGPGTAVMARAPGAAPVRQQAFATHVELAGLLAADGDAPTSRPEPKSPEPEATSVVPRRRSPTALPAAPSLKDPRRAEPASGSRRGLWIGVALLLLGSLAAWRLTRSPASAPARQDAGVVALREASAADAAPSRDAGVLAATPDADVATDGNAVAAPDAAVAAPDAVVAAPDAAVAAPPRPDARPTRPRPDARPVDARPASPDAATASPATIKVGANPWGEVLLDGRPVGRTPLSLPVAPGRHEVEVVFPVVTPARREIYRLELSAGEVRAVLADFSR